MQYLVMPQIAKRLLPLLLTALFFHACGPSETKNKGGETDKGSKTETQKRAKDSSTLESTKITRNSDKKEKNKEQEERSTPAEKKVKSAPTTRRMGSKAPREKPTSSSTPLPGTKAFRKKVDQKPQRYSIPTEQDTSLVCEEGTELHFPAHAFETTDGKAVEGHVELFVKEYYKNAEILLAGLGTKSGDRLLSTGGMVHLEAKSDGEECRLKDGKDMRIGFPREQGQKDMKLFAGKRDANGRMDWEVEASTDLNDTYSAEELDQRASFPGGKEGRRIYIEKNMEYPSTAQARGLEGVVRIELKIARSGAVQDPVLLQNPHETLSKGALSLVRKMPYWNPAQRSGIRVRSKDTLELRFSLDGTEMDQGERTDKPMNAQQFEKKMENGGNIEDASTREVSNYLFRSSRLGGWHNCDRFLEGLQFKEYTVELEDAPNSDVRLFFPEQKSFLTADKGEASEHVFEQVARNEEITVIVIKGGNEGYELAIKRTKSSNEKPELEFEKVTMAKLKEEMKELNGI